MTQPTQPDYSLSKSAKIFIFGSIGLGVLACISLVVAYAMFGENIEKNKQAKVAATGTAQPKDTATSKPTATEKPKPTPSPVPTETPIPSPSDSLTALAEKQFNKEFKKAELYSLPGFGEVATVDYDLGIQWDEGSAVMDATMDFIKFAPEVFKVEGIDVLELRSFTDFKDVYGKTTNEVAFKFTIKRSTADLFDWKSVDRRSIDKALRFAGDGVYVHPALSQAWSKDQNR